jgi:hypothetical protein
MLKPLLLVALLAAALVPSTVPAQRRFERAPDFYFMRLIYTDTRRPTMGRPAPFTCPELGGGDFFPPQGRGWGTDYPGADCKFMHGVNRLTGITVHPDPHVRAITDEDLFDYPYAYIVEPGGMYFSDEEAARLREYLLRGGFVHLDDFWGLQAKANVEDELRKVFPDRRWEELPLSHPVFSTFFDIDEIVQVPNEGRGCARAETWQSADDKEPRIYGISDDDGRLMVLVTYNSDLGDAWEYLDLPCYPAQTAVWALQMGVNSLVYAMTH